MSKHNIWNISWDGKYNSGFRGNKQINDTVDLIATLKMRDSEGDAEFILYREDIENQCLSMCVAGNQWYLYFFPEDVSVCGFQSLGDDRDNRGITHMPAGSNIEVSNYTLLTSEAALNAAVEFMETGEMPLCVEWDEV